MSALRCIETLSGLLPCHMKRKLSPEHELSEPSADCEPLTLTAVTESRHQGEILAGKLLFGGASPFAIIFGEMNN